jgi:hypothetical protein
VPFHEAAHQVKQLGLEGDLIERGKAPTLILLRPGQKGSRYPPGPEEFRRKGAGAGGEVYRRVGWAGSR